MTQYTYWIRIEGPFRHLYRCKGNRIQYIYTGGWVGESLYQLGRRSFTQDVANHRLFKLRTTDKAEAMRIAYASY